MVANYTITFLTVNGAVASTDATISTEMWERFADDSPVMANLRAWADVDITVAKDREEMRKRHFTRALAKKIWASMQDEPTFFVGDVIQGDPRGTETCTLLTTANIIGLDIKITSVRR